MKKEKTIDFRKVKKTKVKKISEMSSCKRTQLSNNLKTIDNIREIIEQISEDNCEIDNLCNKNKTLEILNRVELNKYLNLSLNNSMRSLISLQELNNAAITKINHKRTRLSAETLSKIFIKLKELENSQIRLIADLAKSQQLTLDEMEREIIIIYRSIPNELQIYLYKTILEFVKQCPEIQKAMLKTKHDQEQKEKEESQLKEQILK